MPSNRQKKPRTIKLTGLWLVVVLLVVSFAIRQTEVVRIRRRIEEAQDEINHLRISNSALEQQIETMRTEEYIEKVAREKLGLVMPGEVQYIRVINSQEK
ncbi:MAG: septum formation initiator family protein [Firmicutes bacterium]|jgi:cell division protein FtsL|nr:septum formation initiator family protein [Candidatus Fermentithermobacillaceae bacterium]